MWVVSFKQGKLNPQKPVLPFLTPTAPKREKGFTSAQKPKLIRCTASFSHGAGQSENRVRGWWQRYEPVPAIGGREDGRPANAVQQSDICEFREIRCRDGRKWNHITLGHKLKKNVLIKSVYLTICVFNSF